MEEVKIYKVEGVVTLFIQAKDAEDAQNKAQEWVEDNSSKLTYLFTEYTGIVEAPEE